MVSPQPSGHLASLFSTWSSMGATCTSAPPSTILEGWKVAIHLMGQVWNVAWIWLEAEAEAVGLVCIETYRPGIY